MTTHITKTWFDGEKVVMKEIPESEVYKQKPVAWVCEGISSDEKHSIDYQQEDIDALPVGTMLYTTPPAAQRQWVGLTDEEIMKTWNRVSKDKSVVHIKNFARAVEAKLKEKNT